MARAVSSRRRDSGSPSSEARLEVGAATIALRVEPSSDGVETVRPVEVEARTPQIDQSRWAGDAAASYAQGLGRTLWTHVFSGALGLALTHAARDADAVGKVLTLRVVPRPDAPVERIWLPWELLLDPSQSAFMALSAGWSIVRGTMSQDPARPLPTGRPLRIVVASMLYLDEAPQVWRDSFVHAADQIGWLSHLGTVGGGAGQVDLVPDPDPESLLELLRTTDADVVHIVGAGVTDGIAVRDPTAPVPFPYAGIAGRRDIEVVSQHRVSGDEAAAALSQNPNVALVVLNGCALGGMAEDVNRATGAAVLAHRDTVQDLHAFRLTGLFYPPLLAGASLDLAISDARRRLELEFPGQAAWASTLLFTGWPPARYEPPVQHAEEASPGPGAPATAEHAPAPPSTSDLLRLMHETNLSRLKALPHQEWAPIAAQVETATSDQDAS